METAVGTPASELIGRRCCPILHGTSDPPEKCPVAAVIRSGDWESEAMEVEFLGRIFRVSCTPLLGNDGTLVAVLHLMRDITDQLVEEAEEIRSIRLDALGHLAGGVAHDLNNNFAGIMGFAEMLLAQSLGPTAQSCTEGILQSCRRSADLTQDLLAFAGRGRYEVKPVDIHAVIRSVLRDLRQDLPPGISIREELTAAHATVAADLRQITRMFRSLCSQAVQRMGSEGELKVSSRIPDCGEEDRWGDHTVISVIISDTAQVIAAEEMLRLFEPFREGVELGCEGLAMAAAHGIVYGHNGDLMVGVRASRPGNEFCVRLPLEMTMHTDSPTGVGKESSDRRRRILVVDDERSVRLTSSAFLRAAGFEVVACEGGDEALALFAEGTAPFDLLILDMLMPGLRGDRLLYQIRQYSPDVVAILATGYAFGDGTPCIDLSAFATVLHKPYSRDLLLEAVGRYLPK